jgi:hypothetical protein
MRERGEWRGKKFFTSATETSAGWLTREISARWLDTIALTVFMLQIGIDIENYFLDPFRGFFGATS